MRRRTVHDRRRDVDAEQPAGACCGGFDAGCCRGCGCNGECAGWRRADGGVVWGCLYWSSNGSAANNTVERFVVVARAWSDGRVEAKTLYAGPCGIAECNPSAGWQTVSTPTQGYRAFADINADELVDGADLASVLSNWGDAPRVPFPPSDCPLNLINP